MSTKSARKEVRGRAAKGSARRSPSPREPGPPQARPKVPLLPTLHWRFLVPNFITALVFLIGFFVILDYTAPVQRLFQIFLGRDSIGPASGSTKDTTRSGVSALSTLFLLFLALKLDELDGTVARALDGCSKFGSIFDQLSDFATFGIATPVAVLRESLKLAKTLDDHLSTTKTRENNSETTDVVFSQILLPACCLLYSLASAVRISREIVLSNFEMSQTKISRYNGIPTNVTTTILLGSLTINEWWIERGAGKMRGWHLQMAVCALCVALSVAMVGEWRWQRDWLSMVVWGGGVLGGVVAVGRRYNS